MLTEQRSIGTKLLHVGICTLLFQIEGFLDCLSLQNLYHGYNGFVIDE